MNSEPVYSDIPMDELIVRNILMSIHEYHTKNLDGKISLENCMISILIDCMGKAISAAVIMDAKNAEKIALIIDLLYKSIKENTHDLVRKSKEIMQ